MNTQKQTMGKSARLLVWAIVVAFLAGMVALAVVNLPRGFDMDLGKIGVGKPAVVFVYDNNLSVSGTQTGAMDKIRDEFSGGVEFLVADTGRPQAQQWMAQHQARPAELFFFDAEGQLRHRQFAPLSADELTAVIRQVFGSN